MTQLDYANHVAKRTRVFWMGDVPWVVNGRILRPLAMPHRMRAVDRVEIRKMLKGTRAFLAQWTEGWDTPPCDWWYLCCDQKDYDLASFKGSLRYKVRRGLDLCEVRHVDSTWFAENGYSAYAAAFRHYGTTPLLSEAEFVEEFRKNGEYAGRETWGAFIGGRLVAYDSCIVIDDAVMLSSAKSDPAHFKSRPNEALLYVMTRHYLRERSLTYVSSGSRVLTHDTNFQDFQEHLGYRKIFCLLRIELSPLASILSSLRLGARARQVGLDRMLASVPAKLDAFDTAVRISRSCEDLPVALDQPRESAT